jgi:DNA recombination protein RmuC
MPEDKQLVIDSKVSLTDYERYSSAETDEERERAQKAHLQSIRNHIKELSQKNYQNLYELKSVDFVLMFVPIESAFSLAVQTDLAQNSGTKNIFAEALEQNVVMVTTSTLLATLRTVESIWRQENQNRHALEIARRSGKMYDKLVGFVTDLQQIGSRLDQTQKSYQNAMGKLSEGKGNLVRQAEQIRELGAKASKSLPADVVETSMSDPLQLN